jgi:transposase InsO family protein
METLCRWYGISRQAYYQKRQRQEKQALEAEVALELVREVRKLHPRIGTRKLLVLIQAELAAMDISLGRDRLFTLLRDNGLLVRHRRRRPRTTVPGWRRAENLLADQSISRPNQAWVTDITYLRLESGRFCYLFLVTDYFSRRILGWHLAPSLHAQGALTALNRAVHQAQGPLSGLIHHSDRGCQYTSMEYLLRLQEVGARPSMGQKGNCYENAIAERLNGILKLEYGLDATFRSLAQAQKAVQEALMLYNELRPHCSLKMRTPHQVYAAHDTCTP